MIKVCEACHRGWVPRDGEPPWPKCPTCREGKRPLSRLVGGRPREEADRREREREAKR